MGNPRHLGGVNIAQEGILHISRKLRLRAGSRVHQEGIPALLVRDRRQDGRTLDAFDAADAKKAGSHCCTSGARCHQSTTLTITDKLRTYGDRGILLLTISHTRMLSHFNDFRRVVDFDQRILFFPILFQNRTDLLFLPYQNHRDFPFPYSLNRS